MPDPLKVRILERDHLMLEAALTGSLELGRQKSEEETLPLYQIQAATSSTPARVALAAKSVNNLGRQHVRLDPLPSGAVRVHNGSQVPLVVIAGQPIAPSTSVDLTPPFTLALPRRSIVVAAENATDEFGTQSLEHRTLAPGDLAPAFGSLHALPSGVNLSTLGGVIGWLHTTMGVLQSTVGSADFLDRATQALVQIVGLTSGRVLFLQNGTWTVSALHWLAGEEPGEWRPSNYLLKRVCRDKRTCWQTPQEIDRLDTPSLQHLHTVVAAPLLDAQGEVIGALYGERTQGVAAHPETGKIGALLVDVLACGVSAGLARQVHERAALKAQVQFEQFFTPRLAEQLRQDDRLLEGREAEVTILFCDIRGFSRVSERIGPAATIAWMNDALSELSRCVLDEEGVLVDYVGDELMAMWGAPQPQPDHAVRAVRAALTMRVALAEINERWRERLGESMNLGIGLNTGLAQVGNVGSRYKFKYGAMGNVVNVASRVQGLTKYLKCRLLVTRFTHTKLDNRFLSRRVVLTRVVNVKEPVELYEIETRGSDERQRFFQASEQALTALEKEEFALAAKSAGELLLSNPGDGPLRLVLSRATQMLVQDGEGFDRVWLPPGK